MPSEPEANPSSHIDTGGGTFVNRDLNVGGDFVERDKITVGSVIANFFRGDSDDLRKLRNRQVMIKLVRDIWVKGVLEHSLYNQLLIDLSLEQRPDAVERPWQMVLDIPDQASRFLPTGTKMVDLFNELNQSLLILGKPGSGKSTMLLELARDLLTQAEQNPTLPIPVFFNLSSWAEKRSSIRQWLVEELREKYQIPKLMAQAWIEQDELLLLLDGLDEVKQEYREACVTALNDYQQSCKTLVQLALCSRTAEYITLTRKLKLNGAVILRPLTPQQIDAFLMRAGDKLTSVAQLLQSDAELQDLAQSPLILNILCLTYQDKALDEIQAEGVAGTRLKHLFDAYIVRMFQRPGKLMVDQYPRVQTLRWLAWLAARMVQYAQTEFLIERLQPDWLQAPGQRRVPVRLIMFRWGPLYGLFVGLLDGLIFWLIAILNGELIVRQNDKDAVGLIAVLIISLLGGLILGPISGLFLGLIDWFSGELRRIQSSEQSTESRKRLRSSLYVGLFWWSFFELGFGLSNGAFYGLLGGLLGGFKPAKPANPIRRSWKQLKSNLLYGLPLGLFFGLVHGLYFEMFNLFMGEDPSSVMLFRPSIQLLYGLIGGFVFGLIFEVDAKPKNSYLIVTQMPNKGIKYSAKLSLAVVLIFPSILGLIFGFDSVLFGAVGGLIGGLIGGGDNVMKHLILRFALYRRRHAPLNYSRFLDYCAERIFLRKVGGGYIFVHRLLLEHFAALMEADIQRLAGSTDGR